LWKTQASDNQRLVYIISDFQREKTEKIIKKKRKINDIYSQKFERFFIFLLRYRM